MTILILNAAASFVLGALVALLLVGLASTASARVRDRLQREPDMLRELADPIEEKRS